MPGGKPAGTTCVNLDQASQRCTIWETPDYPAVCRRFRASEDSCGHNRTEAIRLLTRLEQLTL